jgi:hypothetical protein
VSLKPSPAGTGEHALIVRVLLGGVPMGGHAATRGETVRGKRLEGVAQDLAWYRFWR